MSRLYNIMDELIARTGAVMSGTDITTSVPDATKTNTASITLPAGVWIVNFQVGLNVGSSPHTFQATITTTSDNASQQVYSQGVLRHNLTAILSIEQSTTVYGTVYHNIGQAGTALQNKLTAIRIA